MRIVIPGKDENWNGAELFKQSQHGCHERVVNLVILKQIAGDDKRIHLALTSGFQGGFERVKPRLP